MSYENSKRALCLLGLYRPARWARRQLFCRHELKAVQREIQFYGQFVRPGSLCFDIGANYGDKTGVFLCLGANVVAVEPQADCLEELRARIGNNSRLQTVGVAVGASNGVMRMFVEEHRTASSVIENWQGSVVETIDVPVVTLDELIERYGCPGFCKIDVEGYECEVLRGLTRPIPVISFEYHVRNDGLQRVISCLAYLSRFGDYVVNISPAETPRFAGKKWWSKSDFIDFLTKWVPDLHGYIYGDIFVRFEDSVHIPSRI